MPRRPAAPPDLSTLNDEQRARRDRVIRFGELAFGPGWKSALAHALTQLRGREVQDVQVHAWVQGKRPVPADVLDDLICIQIQISFDLHDRARAIQYWPDPVPDLPRSVEDALTESPRPLTAAEVWEEVGD